MKKRTRKPSSLKRRRAAPDEIVRRKLAAHDACLRCGANGARFALRDINRALTGRGRYIVKDLSRTLKLLVQEGLLTRTGTRGGARYTVRTKKARRAA